MPPEDAERARPFRLHIYEGFCRRNHDSLLKCSDSSRRSASFSPFRTSGGLIWGPLAASFGVSSLFFLLSSLFSPLSSLLPCGGGTVPERVGSPLAASSGLSALFSLLSSFCSLLSLLSSLFSRCRSFLRSHFAPAPSIFASGHRRRPQLLRPFAAPSLARRNARSDEIIILYYIIISIIIIIIIITITIITRPDRPPTDQRQGRSKTMALYIARAKGS